MTSTLMPSGEKPFVPFPKLMKATDTDIVVLFNEFNKGTIVFAEDANRIGRYSAIWTMSGFEDYDAAVLLKNGK